MKALHAWMIVENKRPAVFDHRYPIYWLKKIAREDASALCDDGAKIIKVKVTVASRPWLGH